MEGLHYTISEPKRFCKGVQAVNPQSGEEHSLLLLSFRHGVLLSRTRLVEHHCRYTSCGDGDQDAMFDYTHHLSP
jgi:hypothetical protein